MTEENFRPAIHELPRRFTGHPGGRKKPHCDELIARTPEVILERSDTEQDYTHLQVCGRPAVKKGKCARHLVQSNVLLDRNWHRFIRRGG
jgi:hypothetical protein